MFCYNCMNPIGDDGYCPTCRQQCFAENVLHHIRPGTVLNNRYYIGNALGEGGFGITYIGRDLSLDVRVAVKEYYPVGYANRNNTTDNTVSTYTEKQREVFLKGKERFLQEARSLAKFTKEEGVVLVRDYFEDCGTAYIVMEYLEGITLQQYLRQYRTINADWLFEKMLPIISSLERMHNAHIIHRDISPDNIMFLYDGNLKLMDFGSARYYTNEGNEMSVVIKKGYAPEEQYRRNGNQGPWTDVYSLCATIYKCITGQIPTDSLTRAHNDTLRKPSELGVEINPELEAALMYGLAVDQRDRCQNMTVLHDLIMSALDQTQILGYARQYGENTQLHHIEADYLTRPADEAPGQNDPAVKQTAMTSVPSEKKKRSWAPVFIAILAILLLVGIGILVFMLLRGESESKPTPVEETAETTAAEAQTETLAETEAPRTEQEMVEVPDVIGMDLSGAIEALSKRGLKVDQQEVPNSNNKKEIVFSQVPQSGESVAPGSEVTVYFYKASSDEKSEAKTEKPRKETETEKKSEEATYPPESELNHGDIPSRIARSFSYGKKLYCRAKEYVTLRESASRFSDGIGKVYGDSEVTYLESVNDFYKIRYDGKDGYVLAHYFSDDPNSEKKGGLGIYIEDCILFCVADDYVTMWDEPSSSGKPILLIKRGEGVYFIHDDNDDKNYAKITYNGITGYVIGKYFNDDPNGDILPDP